MGLMMYEFGPHSIAQLLQCVTLGVVCASVCGEQRRDLSFIRKMIE